MIISCPNCATRYQIGDANFPAAGRTVRCAKCHQSWHQTAPAESIPTPVPVPASPAQFAITCPQCSARFQADKAKFPAGGRNVRCAKCHHVWHQAGPEGDAPTNAVATRDVVAAPVQTATAPQQTPPPAVANQELSAPGPVVATVPAGTFPSGSPLWKQQPSTFALAIGGLALVGLVCVGVGTWFTVHHHQAIPAPHTALAPVTARPGIELRDVTYKREMSYGMGQIFIINGTIANSTDKELPLPAAIYVGLSDAANHTIYHSEFPPSIKKLGGRQSVSFVTNIYNAPAEARHLTVTLESR